MNVGKALLIALSLSVPLAAAACKNTNDNKPSYNFMPPGIDGLATRPRARH